MCQVLQDGQHTAPAAPRSPSSQALPPPRLSSNVFEQRVLDTLSRTETDVAFGSYAGYGLKAVGFLIENTDLPTEGMSPAALAVNPTKAVIAEAFTKGGEALVERADNLVAQAVLLELDNSVNQKLLDRNGRPNRVELAKVSQTELNSIFTPQFAEKLGNPGLLNGVKDRITLLQLETSLADTEQIRMNTAEIKSSLGEIGSSLDKVLEKQERLAEKADATNRSLGTIKQSLGKNSEILGAIATQNLSAHALLNLHANKALTFSSEDVLKLTRRATADDLLAEAREASGVLAGVSQGLSILGLEKEAKLFSEGSALVSGVGAFAAAMTVQDYFSAAQSAFSVISSIAGFGKRNGPSAEQRMLHLVFQEIRALSQKIDQYHEEEMQLLGEINDRIIDLNAQLRLSVSHILDDIAVVSKGTDELLTKDITGCKMLQSQYLQMVASGLLDTRVGMARWFDNDDRGRKWRDCITSLESLMQVENDTSFSTSFLERSVTESEAIFEDRKQRVRAFESWILQPTIAYLRKHGLDSTNPVQTQVSVYAPITSVCAVTRIQSQTLCDSEEHEGWRRTRLPESRFNVGDGRLLWQHRIFEFTDYVKFLAPFNTAVFEDYGRGGVPRIIAEDELQTVFGRKTLALRTRHLTLTQQSIDALDLLLGQANVIAGLPILDRAATVVDEQIIPLYAKARLQGDSRAIDTEIAPGTKVRDPAIGPRCSTGTFAFDTLCLMQTNRWFRQNVLRVVLLRRLAARGKNWDDWVRAAKLPFSPDVSALLGSDVLLRDASLDSDKAVHPRWSIELPKVNLRSTDKRVDGDDCWALTGATAQEIGTYTRRDNAFCALLPSPTDEKPDQIATYFNLHALLFERQSRQRQLEEDCSALSEYPDFACGWARSSVEVGDLRLTR